VPADELCHLVRAPTLERNDDQALEAAMHTVTMTWGFARVNEGRGRGQRREAKLGGSQDEAGGGPG
jgi:hypothetical protein